MSHDTTALAQVLDWLKNQDDLDWDFAIPADTYAQAVKEGLAATFSFYICSNPDAYGPDDVSPALYAVVYPIGMDATWKGPAFVSPLLPEAIHYDECMETEWHFHKIGLTSPAAIASLLATRGLVFDAAQQTQFYPDIHDEVARAVGTATAATCCTVGKPAAKPPKP